MPGGPWFKFWIKSFCAFVMSTGAQQGTRLYVGHDFNWVPLAVAGVSGLAIFWWGISDTSPEPQTRWKAHAAPDAK